MHNESQIYAIFSEAFKAPKEAASTDAMGINKSLKSKTINQYLQSIIRERYRSEGITYALAIFLLRLSISIRVFSISMDTFLSLFSSCSHAFFSSENWDSSVFVWKEIIIAIKSSWRFTVLVTYPRNQWDDWQPIASRLFTIEENWVRYIMQRNSRRSVSTVSTLSFSVVLFYEYDCSYMP